MKRNCIYTLACMSLLVIMSSCGGNNSSNEVAKLQDSIAALKAQLDNTHKVEYREKVRTSSQSNEQESLGEIPGTYTFTDELGDKWTLTLNEDKSGQLEKGDYVAYCSWKDYRKIDKGVEIMFAADKPTNGRSPFHNKNPHKQFRFSCHGVFGCQSFCADCQRLPD